EAGVDHQVDVLHVRARLEQVPAQAAEHRGLDALLGGVGVGHGACAAWRRTRRDNAPPTVAQPPPERMTAPDPQAGTQARILDGRRIAEDLLDSLRARVEARVAAGKPRPGLAVVLVGSDPASAVYVRNKRRAAEK